MNGRRPLAALLGELAESVAGFAGGDGRGPGAVAWRSRCRSTSAWSRATDGYELIGDVPLFRMRTDFDPEPARLEVEWHAIPWSGEARP